VRVGVNKHGQRILAWASAFEKVSAFDIAHRRVA
jgi:hypothetical protein